MTTVDDAVLSFKAARTKFLAAEKAATGAVPAWPDVTGPIGASQKNALAFKWEAEAEYIAAGQALLHARLEAQGAST